MDILVIFLLSFLPMSFYAFILWWLDRYEKEPWGLLTLAVLWGAIPAIIGSLIFEMVFDIPLTAMLPGGSTAYELASTAVFAPFIEEGIKGTALLAMLLFWRKELDSPLDGVIYGGMVGFGFAAVENFFYFLSAYEGGMSAVWELAFYRAGLFGLNHAMFTGFTGLGIALALEVKPKGLRPILPLVGFVFAVGGHMFHNGMATLIGSTESILGVVVLVAGDWFGAFCLLIVAIVSLMLERRRLSRYLGLAVTAGLIPAGDLPMLLSLWPRLRAYLKMLGQGNVTAWWRLGRYFDAVTEAALAWHRQERGDVIRPEERLRLERKVADQRQLLVAGGWR